MKSVLVAALVSTVALLAWAAASYARRKSAWRLLRLAGAAFLLVTVATHVCEELHLLPFMGWGSPHSAGHYLDLTSVILGVAFLLAGFLGPRLAPRKAHHA